MHIWDPKNNGLVMARSHLENVENSVTSFQSKRGGGGVISLVYPCDRDRVKGGDS